MFSTKWNIYITSLLPKLRDHCRRGDTKRLRAGGSRQLHGNCFQTSQDSCTYELTAIMTTHVTSTSSSQTKSERERESEHDVTSLAEQLNFLKVQALLSRPCSSGRSHINKYMISIKWNSMGANNQKDRKLGRQGKGWIWEETEEWVNMIKTHLQNSQELVKKINKSLFHIQYI